jgi:sec-independent protein translocase protein TatC
MDIIKQIKDLRKKVFISIAGFLLGAVLAYIFYNQILKLLLNPISAIIEPDNKYLFITTIYEGFLAKLKISIIFGLIASLPVHLYNIITFIFPGLKAREKKILITATFASLFLIVFALYFTYIIILPISIEFLTNQQFIPQNTGLLLSFRKNVFHILYFLLYSTLIFQTPVLIEILLYLNLIKRKNLFKHSRYIIIFIFVISAIVTPPDIISQILLSIPLISLFFLTILIAKIFNWGNKEWT